jgi:hypothetical protein
MPVSEKLEICRPVLCVAVSCPFQRSWRIFVLCYVLLSHARFREAGKFSCCVMCYRLMPVSEKVQTCAVVYVAVSCPFKRSWKTLVLCYVLSRARFRETGTLSRCVVCCRLMPVSQELEICRAVLCVAVTCPWSMGICRRTLPILGFQTVPSHSHSYSHLWSAFSCIVLFCLERSSLSN